MEKLKLSSKAFTKGEVLNRAQLKKVMGGDGSESTGCATTCKCPVGWNTLLGHIDWSIGISPCNDTCIASNESYVTCGTSAAIRCDDVANYGQHCYKTIV